MKHIGILGSFGNGNLGDEAAWISVKNFFISKDPLYKYHTHIFTWGSPFLVCGYHTNLFYTIFDNELQWINENFDALIITGGGIVGWQWGLTCLPGLDVFFDKLTIPVYVISVSAEPGMYDENNIKVLKAIKNKAKIFTVRDKHSQSVIKNLIGDDIEITPDIVTILESTYSSDMKKLDKLKDIILVNASNCLSKEIINFWQDVFEKIEGKDTISCVPFVPSRNDIILSTHTGNNNTFDFYQPEEIIDLFKYKKFIIAGRLHAAVFAANAKTPFIAINYHPKVKDFCDSINYPYYYPKHNDYPLDTTKYGIDFMKINKEELIATIKDAINNPVCVPDFYTAQEICERVWSDLKSPSIVVPCVYCGEDISNFRAETVFEQCPYCKNINQK